MLCSLVPGCHLICSGVSPLALLPLPGGVLASTGDENVRGKWKPSCASWYLDVTSSARGYDCGLLQRQFSNDCGSVLERRKYTVLGHKAYNCKQTHMCPISWTSHC